MSSSTSPNPEWDRILIASQKNDAQLIEHLITNMNVSPNHSNAVGQSPLHIAALWGNLDACTTLLKHNANPNAQNQINGATPLHSAVQSVKKPISMRTKCIQKILEKIECNPHTMDMFGFTPLSCLEKILSGGSRVSLDELTMDDLQDLHVMKDVLVAAMAQADSQRNPLFQIIDECDIDQMRITLDDNDGDQEFILCSINEKDHQTPYSPLSYVIAKIVKDVEEIRYNNDNNDLPDEQAISRIENWKEMVLLLLKNGAEVQRTVHTVPGKLDEEKDPFEDICTSLSDMIIKAEKNYDDYAQIISCLKEIAIELHSKVVTDVSTKTISCLHNGARRGKLEIVQFWIEKLDVDVNIKGRQGLTALHFAARSGKVEVAEYLLQNEAIDVDVVDDRGKKAIYAAFVNGKEDIVELIQQKSSSKGKLIDKLP